MQLRFFKVLVLLFTFCLASASINGGMVVMETEINNGTSIKSSRRMSTIMRSGIRSAKTRFTERHER